MKSLWLKEPTTLESIGGLLQSRFPDRFAGEIKNDRLRLVESKTKGCIISLRSKNGGTSCFILGFMPSLAHRALLLVGILATLSFLTSLVLGGFNILVGGAIPFAIAFFSMSFPSRALVADISAVVSCEFTESARPRIHSSRWWPIAGAGLGVVLLVALAVSKWPATSPATESTPDNTAAESTAPSDRIFPQTTNEDLVNEYSVVAEVSGRIYHLHPDLKPGEIISRGSVLVRIGGEDLVHSLRRMDAELNARQSELETIEAEESVVQKTYESRRQQLTGEGEERLKFVARQEVGNLLRELEILAKRRQFSESGIATTERELTQLRENLERTEISLSVDVRIDAVMVEHDEFVSVSAVLFRASEVKTE